MITMRFVGTAEEICRKLGETIEQYGEKATAFEVHMDSYLRTIEAENEAISEVEDYVAYIENRLARGLSIA